MAAKKKAAKSASAAKPASKAKTVVAKAADNAPIKQSYAANMSSLNALELRCEKDESDLTARLIGLALATNNGTDVTGGTYEIDEETELGNLSFEEYETETDKQSLKAIHKTQGDTFLFEGEAFVKNEPVKLLAFREN